MEKKWCMCKELKEVARDGDSTCLVCGGKDAYGFSKERPKDKKKICEWSNSQNLRNLYETETGNGCLGVEDEEVTDSFTNEYVYWLEDYINFIGR